MNCALIGYTGFVGSNLLSSQKWSALINSTNINDYSGESFDYALIAVGDARKWLANKCGALDQDHILNIFFALERMSFKKIDLITTVDVYGDNYVDSDSINEESIIFSNEPYGLNRLLLENLIVREFKNVQIFRLPGLVGKGLKKNLIFDLVNKREDFLKNYHPESRFQYVDLSLLGSFIKNIGFSEGRVVNFVSEPLSVEEIGGVFGFDYSHFNKSAKVIKYNVRTKFNSDGYFYNKADVLKMLRSYAR